MNLNYQSDGIDWSPIIRSMEPQGISQTPRYPGNLKAVLLNHAGLAEHPQGDKAYQLAREIARLTTFSDAEITYWFSRITELI
ncbi:hypothetical protein [Calothrix sp. PCC 7507]|uniref:hypothetical protein n=1 Tax=Calothrix sp. PCC 7507 TaxID=99598 RepID=UPI00029F04A9|nr:hypothetical protein [Calothrix sp. PCC 7507]AFY32955.1 hypothetical protein Cal7507_2527 [Calothrix sp. PCC 7507]